MNDPRPTYQLIADGLQRRKSQSGGLVCWTLADPTPLLTNSKGESPSCVVGALRSKADTKQPPNII